VFSVCVPHLELSMMMRPSLAVPFALLALTAACVDDEGTLGTGAQGLVIFNGNGDPCPKTGCGSNSAFVGPTEFHELDETGVMANAEGLRITGFKKGDFSFKLDVTGTTLTGKLYSNGSWVTVLSGSSLVGSKIFLSGPSNAKYEINIVGVTAQPMWQAPFTSIETYELTWNVPGTGYIAAPPNVCVDPPNRKEGEMALWANTKEAILFTGDRYNTDDLTVTSTAPSSWFNIACAGTVMAKLALNRHTTATTNSAMPTTWAQRQAMLKMYTSDVCGAGDALTVTGTPIQWVSITGLTSPAPYSTAEARWNERGAMCLTTHRLNNTPLDMDDEIEASCASVDRPVPSPCASHPPPWYLRTTSPATP
jgi:hypothetical protein